MKLYSMAILITRTALTLHVIDHVFKELLAGNEHIERLWKYLWKYVCKGQLI